MFKTQQGAALLEYLISLTLSNIIILTALQIYASHVGFAIQTYQDRLRIGQNGVGFFQQALQQAGNMGCLSQQQYHRLHAPPQLGMYLQSAVSTNGRELTVQGIAAGQAYLIKQKSKNEFLVSNQPQFKRGQIIIISDCLQADILQINAVHQIRQQQLLSTTTATRSQYDAYATVAALKHNRFFVQSRGKSGLYLEDITQHKHFILADIKQLKVIITTTDINIKLIAHNKIWLIYAKRI